MGALKTFLGLCAIFVAWVLIGFLNVVFMSQGSWSQGVVVVVIVIWFLSGPLWVCLFLRWRRQRFIKAFDEVQERLAEKTRKHLKDHSTQQSAT